eukprot:UN02350
MRECQGVAHSERSRFYRWILKTIRLVVLKLGRKVWGSTMHTIGKKLKSKCSNEDR